MDAVHYGPVAHEGYWSRQEVWLPSLRQTRIIQIYKRRERYDKKMTIERRSCLQQCLREWYGARRLSKTDFADRILRFSKTELVHKLLLYAMQEWQKATQVVKRRQNKERRVRELWRALGQMQDQCVEALKIAFASWKQFYYGKVSTCIESAVSEFLGLQNRFFCTV